MATNGETAYEEGTEGRAEVRAVDWGRIVAGGAAGVTIAAAPGVRAGGPCALVATPEALAPAWTGAVDDLRREIAELPASDCRPMTLSIVASGGAVRVVAITGDGRRTERTVARPDSLVATALGLLLTIPAETPAPPPAPPPPSAATAAPPPPRRAIETGPAAPAPPPPALALWAGLAAGLRLTAPTAVTVFDVEARLDLMLDRWLLLSTIRSALVSCLGGQGVDCDVYNDVSLGVGVGRRVRAGTAAVDFALEPSIVWMHMEYDVPGALEAESVAGSEVALRLDASARIAVPLAEGWALTLTVDGGLAPTMLGTTRLELPVSLAGVAQPPHSQRGRAEYASAPRGRSCERAPAAAASCRDQRRRAPGRCRRRPPRRAR